MDATVVVVADRQRVATDLAFDLETSLLGVWIDRVLSESESDAERIAGTGIDAVDQQILRANLSLADDPTRPQGLIDLRGGHGLARQRAANSRQPG